MTLRTSTLNQGEFLMSNDEFKQGYAFGTDQNDRFSLKFISSNDILNTITRQETQLLGCNDENDLRIVLKETLLVLGLTTTEIKEFELLKRELNIYLHLRLNRFLLTAFPYFFDTEKTIDISLSFKYVKTIELVEKEQPDKMV